MVYGDPLIDRLVAQNKEQLQKFKTVTTTEGPYMLLAVGAAILVATIVFVRKGKKHAIHRR